MHGIVFFVCVVLPILFVAGFIAFLVASFVGVVFAMIGLPIWLAYVLVFGGGILLLGKAL